MTAKERLLEPVAHLRTEVEAAITGNRDQLLEVSHRIHELSELGFTEHDSVRTLGAFLGVAAVVGRTGGSVTLLGTPAEENGGGKEILARRGAFTDTDAVLMVHPMAGTHDVAHFESLGCRSVRARFHGKAAHASAAPELGCNALDATVAAYQGIAALRQHITDSDRVHGIITDGGTAPNVVPEHAESVWLIRSATLDGMAHLCQRVEAIFEAAATMTGTRLELHWDLGPAYVPVRSNRPLDLTYATHARARGRRLADDLEGPLPQGGSTDLGNVSVRVPAIHPSIAIAPPSVPMHSLEFAESARSAASDDAVLDAAIALALTAVDYLTDPDLRERTGADFAASGGHLDVPGALRTTSKEEA